MVHYRYQFIGIFLLTFVVNNAKSQYTPNIGVYMPDLKISKIINFSKKSAKISDFKDQLLIIDFWSIGCAGCIEAMPKMEMLQKKLGNKIFILPVAMEKEAVIRDFWKNNIYTSKINLPSVVEDVELNNYFKHRSIPHEVWVYKGKIIAITEPEYVDESNIIKILNGEKINWPLKYDYYSFDQNKPLFTLDEKQLDTAHTHIDYAAISDFREGAVSMGFSGAPGTIRNILKNNVRTFFLNESIFGSYQLYWGMLIKSGSLIKPSRQLFPNQIIWEVNDRSKYKYDKKYGYREEWLRDNAICFESVHSDANKSEEQVWASIISDMNALLGLKVRWEKRKERVLKLINVDFEAKKKNQHVNGISYSIQEIIYYFSQIESNPYLFNETRLNQRETLKLDISSWSDISLIRKQLLSYGLEIKEDVQIVDKFLFKEVDGGLLIDAKMQALAKKRRLEQSNLDRKRLIDSVFLKDEDLGTGIVVTPSGLKYKVVKNGKGQIPNKNSKVKVHYTGMLTNGTIFDSSLESGKPIEFIVSEAIPGWIEALQIMTVGSKWILYIPASLAYGGHTAQGTIPPNSPLIFEIELIDTKS